MPQNLSQEELANWKRDPITKKLFSGMGFVVEDLKEMLVSGVQDVDYTRGFIHGIRFLMQYEVPEGEEGNE